MKLTAAQVFGDSFTTPKTHKADFSKVASLFKVGSTVNTIDGNAYRVLSRISGPNGFTFRLANLQGTPVETPANFYPVSRYYAKVARWMRQVLSYNKDWDLYVKEYIRAAGLPVDNSWNWAKWFEKKFVPSLKGDEEAKDEAVHQTIITALGQRRALDPSNPHGFQHVIERFPEGVKKLPLEKQVTQFLLTLFLGRKQEANLFIDKIQPPNEQSIIQNDETGDDGDVERNILDTEEHAIAPQSQEEAEFRADMESFRALLAQWLPTRVSPVTAENNLRLWDSFIEWILNEQVEPKISDLYPLWAQKTIDAKHPKGLSTDSMKVYYAKFPGLLKQFINDNRDELGDNPLVAAADRLPAPAKSAPAKASSLFGGLKIAAADDMCEACGQEVANRECAHGILCDKCDKQVHGGVGAPCDLEKPRKKTSDDVSSDFSEAKAETVSPNTVDADIAQGRTEAEPIEKLEKQAKKEVCSECGEERSVGPNGLCHECEQALRDKESSKTAETIDPNYHETDISDEGYCTNCGKEHRSIKERDGEQLCSECRAKKKSSSTRVQADAPGVGGIQGLDPHQNPNINKNNAGVPKAPVQNGNEPDQGLGPTVLDPEQDDDQQPSMKHTVPPELPNQRLHLTSLHASLSDASMKLAGADPRIKKIIVDAAIADSIAWSGKYQEYIAKRGYFYRHGMTADKFAQAIKQLIPEAIITKADDHWHPWPKDSWFEVRFKVPQAEEVPTTEPSQQEEVMAEPKAQGAIASKRADLIKRIRARKAGKLVGKFSTLRQVAKHKSAEVGEALEQLGEAFGELADRVHAFRENLDLVDAPKTANLKVRIAAARSLGTRFRQIANDSPEMMAEAINELFHTLDDVAAGVENLADNLGIELVMTPAEEAFVEEGKEEVRGDVPEIEKTEEPKVDEHKEEKAEEEIKEEDKPEEKEANSGPGAQGFSTDRDESGQPKTPQKVSIPEAQG